VTEVIADALRGYRLSCGPLREWIKTKLRYRLRAYGRSIQRRRLRETLVAHRPRGYALPRPEEGVAGAIPEPWSLIDNNFNVRWFDEQLGGHSLTDREKLRYRNRFLRERKRRHVDLSPLQEPGWSPKREQEWEASCEEKVSEFPRSVVLRYIERVLAHATLVSLVPEE
jgi:hypothetical protein